MGSNLNDVQGLIRMIQSGGGDPSALALNMLAQRSGNPLFSNLYQLAQTRDTNSLEAIARNMCKERGLDFDKEFAIFKQQLLLGK